MAEKLMPWFYPKNKAPYSIHEIRKFNRERIYDLIKSHPDFPKLKKSVRSYDVRNFGREYADKHEQERTIEEYITNVQWNAKSAATIRQNGLQSQITRDLNIPTHTASPFRGLNIDWHKVAVMQAIAEDEPVPADVRESFGITNG